MPSTWIAWESIRGAKTEATLRSMWPTWTVRVGLSNPPSHPPNPPKPLVPDPFPPDPTAPVVGRRSRALKPDVGGSVSSPLLQNPWNPTHPKSMNIMANSPAFWRDFSLISQISSTKTIRSGINTTDPTILSTIWGKNHRIWRNLCQIWLDLTGSWPDWARSGEISLIFNGFRWVLASPETDPTRRTSNPRNPNLLIGRLRVGFLLTWSLTGRLRVGHKPDPLDPRTALGASVENLDSIWVISMRLANQTHHFSTAFSFHNS